MLLVNDNICNIDDDVLEQSCHVSDITFSMLGSHCIVML